MPRNRGSTTLTFVAVFALIALAVGQVCASPNRNNANGVGPPAIETVQNTDASITIDINTASPPSSMAQAAATNNAYTDTATSTFAAKSDTIANGQASTYSLTTTPAQGTVHNANGAVLNNGNLIGTYNANCVTLTPATPTTTGPFPQTAILNANITGAGRASPGTYVMAVAAQAASETLNIANNVDINLAGQRAGPMVNWTSGTTAQMATNLNSGNTGPPTTIAVNLAGFDNTYATRGDYAMITQAPEYPGPDASIASPKGGAGMDYNSNNHTTRAAAQQVSCPLLC